MSTTVLLQTHRHEFSEYAMTQLNYFTQVHKYDERKSFKEAWKKWITSDDIAQMIELETQKLHSEGFAGDIEDKMFKAVRYYFRKKSVSELQINKNLPKKEKTPRKKYVGLSGKILTSIDSHIISKIKENLKEQKQQNEQKPDKIHFKSNVSPDKSFNDFYSTNTEIIEEETELLQKDENMSNEEIEFKIKKTYKNRYQTIRKKLQR
jgi:hypothetical protein